MSSFRPGRFFGTLLGTVAILAAGAYCIVVIVAPLPAPSVTPVTVEIVEAAPITLNIEGSAAVRAAAAATPLAVVDAEAARPMAAITKLVTALVVLDAKPMNAGEPGESITMSVQDYSDYIDYSNEDARTVIVIQGETWTQEEALQALILGSSNNHADTLARWAFGSVDEFLAASAIWLESVGLHDTTLADATGLSDESVGTAADLSLLSELALGNPVIEQILANPAASLVNDRGVSNTTPFLEDQGVTGISRSYTDEAGVCFLFRLNVEGPDGVVPLYGAVLGSPGYESLEIGIEALSTSAPAGVEPVAVIEDGTSYGHVETAWGQRIDAVAGNDVFSPRWELGTEPATISLDAAATLSPASAGTTIGRVTVPTRSGELSAPIELNAAVTDPGPFWRLTHPIALLASLLGGNE